MVFGHLEGTNNHVTLSPPTHLWAAVTNTAVDAVFAFCVISESSNSASSSSVGLSMMDGMSTTTPVSFSRDADSFASCSECPPSSKKSDDGVMVDSSTFSRRAHRRATVLNKYK